MTASFVSRTFELRSASDVQPVTLHLGPPEPDPASGAWRCRIRLRGLPTAFDRHAFGEDGLQALLLALDMARVLLTTTPLPTGTQLTWCDDADLGLFSLPLTPRNP